MKGQSAAEPLPPHVRDGTASDGVYRLDITPERAGWTHSGLRILDLEAGVSHTFDTAADEMIVLPLAGGCVVSGDGFSFELAGRPDVFSAVSDFAYVPRDTRVTVETTAGGRFALPSARASRTLAPRYVPAVAVAVELRGAGAASRQVNNFCSPDEFEADRLIAVEVLTPGGNWSSWPPHKHDVASADESALEEIYYFEVRSDGPAFQRVYSSGEGHEIEVAAEVRTGDAVLIPWGYHGPSMAAPGYDLYYLNVMAGPGERVWRICDDPAHAWIRSTWADQPVDPRLPMAVAR